MKNNSQTTEAKPMIPRLTLPNGYKMVPTAYGLADENLSFWVYKRVRWLKFFSRWKRVWMGKETARLLYEQMLPDQVYQMKRDTWFSYLEYVKAWEEYSRE